jgi:TfoX/Sxy family transcriptional regulator of competence genes
MSFACEELSQRIRDMLDPRLPVSEKKMFGGRAFMLSGNMLVAVSKEGILLVRVGKDALEQHLALPGASPVRMGARTMNGFVEVSGDVLEDDNVLAQWLASARAFVGTLPPK